jgi:hypothetical protein
MALSGRGLNSNVRLLMNHCRLCGANSVFVKSHVIQEAFFRELRSDGEAPLIVASKMGHLPKKAPIGVYDPSILCALYEARFSSFGVIPPEINRGVFKG